MNKTTLNYMIQPSHKRSAKSKLVNLATIYSTDLINMFLSEHNERRTITGGNCIGFAS